MTLLDRVAAGCFALALLAPATALAQGAYGAVPLGGRSALMGNGGVVLARDGAAPFLNPATTVYIREDSVAFSVNIYSVEYAVIRNYQAPGAIDRAHFGALAFNDTKFAALRFDALPSTFCLFLNVGSKATTTPSDRVRQKLAFCLGTTERRVFEGAALQASSATGPATARVSTFRRSFARVLVGPSYAAAFGNRVTVGAALHVVSTAATTLFSADSTTIAPSSAIESGYGAATSAQSFDLAALVGATYAIDRATTFGLAFAPPTVHVTGDNEATLRSQYTAGETISETRLGKGSFSAPTPMRIAAGMGVILPHLRLELDATYYFAMSAAFRSSLTTDRITVREGVAIPDTLHVDSLEAARAVVDTSLGVEILTSKQRSILLGFSEAFNASPPTATELGFGAIETAQENRMMGSFGVGFSLDGSELLVGAQLSTTWGKTAAINSYVLPNQAVFANERTYGGMLVIAGSTSFKTIRGAVGAGPSK